MRKTVAALLLLATATTGCASLYQEPKPKPFRSTTNQSTMAAELSYLSDGTLLRIDRRDGTQLKGRLVKAELHAIVLRTDRNAAAPPVTVPLADIDRVTKIESLQIPKTIAKKTGTAVANVLLFTVFVVAVWIDSVNRNLP